MNMIVGKYLKSSHELWVYKKACRCRVEGKRCEGAREEVGYRDALHPKTIGKELMAYSVIFEI